MKKIWKQRYQIMEEAGSGGNGKVYKVWDVHLEKVWAMKMLEERIPYFLRQKESRPMDELTVLKRISHPNFPRIVDAFEEENRSILIMDYIQGITLEEMIKKGPVKEEEMVLIMSQICDAISYLHHNTPTLLYLDLKPSNIIIEENKTVKMIDLGSVLMKGQRGKISGSFGYASPEQIRVQREGIYLTEQSDIFSFGMILYAMATGSSTRLPMIEEKRRYGVWVRRENPFLSVTLEKIIEKCTRGNCNRRYASMREVKKDLESWASYLKRKKSFVFPHLTHRTNRRNLWYQEKSIFCTEGNHSFYITKKILVLLICILCLIPGKESRAGENLEVIVRDSKLRKILIKKGCAYETDSAILLEIPWKEITGENCLIRVECEDESREKKQFSIQCIYAK